MSAKLFIFKTYGRGEVWLRMDTLVSDDSNAVLAEARRIVAATAACDRVEIWTGQQLVETVRGETLDDA